MVLSIRIHMSIISILGEWLKTRIIRKPVHSCIVGTHCTLIFMRTVRIAKNNYLHHCVRWMNPVLCIHVPDSSLYIICVFYSSRIRTLVAMVSIDL